MPLTFTTNAQPDEAREPIFSVDGNDYTIAKAVPASAGLEYVRIGVEVGTDAAVLYAMRTALGQDAFNALRAATDVSTEDMRTVMDACTGLLLGAVNGPKSNSIQRLNELAWIHKHYREVESDMSVLHRIDDSPSYPNSARWFERAEQLPCYDGAVRWTALHQRAQATPTTPDVPSTLATSQLSRLAPVAASMADNFGDICSYAAVSADG